MIEIKLSVLVTTYNLEKYIDTTLESILMQEVNFRYEVLIGDDGSSDGTIEKIKRWLKKYPDLIKLYVMERSTEKEHDPIIRASLNRVNLLEHARGQYCTCLDGDDFYTDKYKLQKQFDILEKRTNNDCIMCSHNINYYYDQDGSTKPVSTLNIEKKLDSKVYWGKGYWIHAEAMVFRNIFLNGIPKGFNKNYFDDNLIVFYLLKFGRIYYLPDNMLNYRIHNTQWNSKNQLEQNILNLFDYDRECKINPSFKRQSLRRHSFNMIYVYKNRKDVTSQAMYNKYYIKARNESCILSEKLLGYYKQPIFCRILLSIGIKLLSAALFFERNLYKIWGKQDAN